MSSFVCLFTFLLLIYMMVMISVCLSAVFTTYHLPFYPIYHLLSLTYLPRLPRVLPFCATFARCDALPFAAHTRFVAALRDAFCARTVPRSFAR